ncbi:MAG: rhomboid family intramembrane serine protease [Deltaproteobacteria bacterium]|nr:rhomboid family intramembrane serine protease [Deltaproteobacteria bacterium]
MIPIRDTVKSRHVPAVTRTLVVVNVLVFLNQISLAEAQNAFIFTYGLVPARYSVADLAAHFTLGQQCLSFASFMFLHGSFWHLLGNMWFLHIFGDNVEDYLGHWRFLLFYFFSGLASGATHFLSNLYSPVPAIGASGAVAGVMGSYFLLYPRARIVTLIPIVIIPYFVEIPAVIFLAFWFFMQLISATAEGVQASGVAWWAHIGGFLFGVVYTLVKRRVYE